MPAYTSKHTLPYPLDSERIADYPTTARNIAEKLDQLIPKDNEIVIGGKAYQRTGAWGRDGTGIPPFSFRANYGDMHATEVQIPVPYDPPAGYGFHVYVLATSGYTWCHAVGGIRNGKVAVRIIQLGSTDTRALDKIGWILVKTEQA